MKKVGVVLGILLVGLFVASIVFFNPDKKPDGTVTTNPGAQVPTSGLPEGESSASSTGPSPVKVIPVKPAPQPVAVGSEVTSERIRRGAKALTRNDLLDRAAQAHVDDMFAKGYFAHVSPTQMAYFDFIKAEGYNYAYAGENVAACCKAEQTSQSVVTAWVNSPTHLANLESGGYTETGIAMRDGMSCTDVNTGITKSCILIVQMFGLPK